MESDVKYQEPSKCIVDSELTRAPLNTILRSKSVDSFQLRKIPIQKTFSISEENFESDVNSIYKNMVVRERDNNDIAICVTVYNEGAEALVDSLNGILQAKQYMHRMLVNRNSIHLPEVTICLVLDGVKKLSKSLVDYLSSLKGLSSLELNPSSDYEYYEGRIGDSLPAIPNLVKSGISDQLEHPQNVYYLNQNIFYGKHRVIILNKKQNRGKLHSHWLFFNVVGQLEKTKYFVQLDVGVKPLKTSLHDMWLRMESSEGAAAIAARSYVPATNNIFNALDTYQYSNFAYERVMSWPIEDLVGYLSVLPGQMHMLRREALTNAADDVQNFALLKGPVSEQYFRGMDDDLSPFEANMYLAEDRVLGLGMVFDVKKSWKLEYCPTAEAIVDKCETWPELLKQRRRWICSGFTSRLWLIGKTVNSISRQQPLAKNIGECIKVLYFLLMSLVEIVNPAITLGSYTAIYYFTTQAVSHLAYAPAVINGVFGIALVCYLICVKIAWRDKITENQSKFITFSINYQSAILPLCVALVLVFNLGKIDFTYWAPFVALTALLSFINPYLYSKNTGNDLAKSFFTFGFFRPPIELLLQTYAVTNLHNTSWGTKGLNEPVFKTENRLAMFRQFRNRVGFGLLVVNALAIAEVVNLAVNYTVGLISVLMVYSFIMVSLSFAAFLRKYRKIYYQGVNNEI